MGSGQAQAFVSDAPGLALQVCCELLDTEHMRSLRIPTLLLLLVLFVGVMTTPAAAKRKKTTKFNPKITLSPSTVNTGETVTVTGKGFKRKKSYAVTINKTKFLSSKTSRSGRLSFTIALPADAWQELQVNVRSTGKTVTQLLNVADGQPNINGDPGLGSLNAPPSGGSLGPPSDDPDDPDPNDPF